MWIKRQFLFSHNEEFSTVGQALWCKYKHCDPFGHPSLPIFFHPRHGCGCGFGHLPLDCPDSPNSHVPWTNFLQIFAVEDLVVPSPVIPVIPSMGRACGGAPYGGFSCGWECGGGPPVCV